MHSKQLVSLNKSLLQVLKNAGLNDLFNCSDTVLLKILSIAERKLFDGDYRDLMYNPTRVTFGFVKKLKITALVFIKTCSLLAVFFLLNLKCKIQNYFRKVHFKSKLKAELVFVADTARSFEGFRELATIYPDSSVICILHPHQVLSIFKPLPDDNIYYTTATNIRFSTLRRLFKFIFNHISRILDENSIINAIEVSKTADFFVYFCKNSVLTKYVFCSGERGVKDFENDMSKEFVFNISAPLQVIVKPAEPDKKIQIIYDVVIIASFDMIYNHINYCKLFEFFKDSGLSVLVRNHPDVPLPQQQMIITAVGNCDESKGNSLINDIAKGNIILCSSEDSLLHCLLQFKKVIFYPVTDGDAHYFCESFEDVLPNLVVVSDKNEMKQSFDKMRRSDIDETKYPIDYFEKLEYLFGTNNKEKMKHNFQAAIAEVKNKTAILGN